jgi:hypothetical protein
LLVGRLIRLEPKKKKEKVTRRETENGLQQATEYTTE